MPAGSLGTIPGVKIGPYTIYAITNAKSVVYATD